MNKYSKIAALLGAITVLLGAFGAHGLKPHLTEYQINIFEKGIQYQFIHTLLLLFVGHIMDSNNNPKLRWVTNLLIAGIVCFSGSLYLLACKDILPINVIWAGPITPLGGVCFAAAWILLINSSTKS
jgi:uncharacterized membrane protein YgdD (TMEM256/DUF423 family)